MFNSKKLSFNQSGGKYSKVTTFIATQNNKFLGSNAHKFFNKEAISTSKIYSRNDANMTLGAGCFLTTSDGIMDKRYSNRARQPKQTYYFSKNKNRMNKTMVSALNKSGGSHKVEYMIQTTAPPKRSGSGKVKKPKSGRQVSRNTKNAAIYTMAPAMTMTYKKKAKTFK